MRIVVAVAVLLVSVHQSRAEGIDYVQQPYRLDAGVKSRSITFENPTGAPGQGAKAASELGVGRKGDPAREIKPGETVQLCDIEGPGVIRHVWMTTRPEPLVMRSFVIRVYWDGQEHPSIECPFGDFFGTSHGRIVAYQSAVHSVGGRAGMNLWLPMPFTKRARMTITNEGSEGKPLFYQIDYTIGDKVAEDAGRLHVLFRRENPTTEKQDFELLPKRSGRGRYIGTVIGVRDLPDKRSWNEGEVKIYLDGDTEFPTIAGTGTEDYVGLSWGFLNNAYLYNGCTLRDRGYYTVYRWHLPDPIFWEKDIRVTCQQITMVDRKLVETTDDWSCATFWYEPVPSAPLPKFPDLAARTEAIWADR